MSGIVDIDYGDALEALRLRGRELGEPVVVSPENLREQRIFSGASNRIPVCAPGLRPITRWPSQYHQSPSYSRTSCGTRSLKAGMALLVHRSGASNTWLSDDMTL